MGWLHRCSIMCYRVRQNKDPLQHSSNLSSGAHISLQHRVQQSKHLCFPLIIFLCFPRRATLSSSTLIKVRHTSENMSELFSYSLCLSRVKVEQYCAGLKNPLWVAANSNWRDSMLQEGWQTASTFWYFSIRRGFD